MPSQHWPSLMANPDVIVWYNFLIIQLEVFRPISRGKVSGREIHQKFKDGVQTPPSRQKLKFLTAIKHFDGHCIKWHPVKIIYKHHISTKLLKRVLCDISNSLDFTPRQIEFKNLLILLKILFQNLKFSWGFLASFT